MLSHIVDTYSHVACVVVHVTMCLDNMEEALPDPKRQLSIYLAGKDNHKTKDNNTSTSAEENQSQVVDQLVVDQTVVDQMVLPEMLDVDSQYINISNRII